MVDETLRETLRGVIKDSSQLLNLSDRDFSVLQERASTLQGWADHIVKVFYDKLFSHEGALKIIGDTPRNQLEKTLKEWYLSLLKGKPNEEFWLSQWFVGLAHIARGVSNAYMLSTMSLMQLEFGRLCFQEFDDYEAWRVFEAFKKITDIIAILIVEGYLNLYKEAVEGMSGMKPALIDRMAFLESQKMWKNYKSQRG